MELFLPAEIPNQLSSFLSVSGDTSTTIFLQFSLLYGFWVSVLRPHHVLLPSTSTRMAGIFIRNNVVALPPNEHRLDLFPRCSHFMQCEFFPRYFHVEF